MEDQAWSCAEDNHTQAEGNRQGYTYGTITGASLESTPAERAAPAQRPRHWSGAPRWRREAQDS